MTPGPNQTLMSLAARVDELQDVAAQKSNLFINVKDEQWGVTGLGIANDGPGIQAALDAANAAGGGTVFFPLGRYRWTSTLVVGKAHILCQGGAQFDRTAPGTLYGTVFIPDISTPDAAAIRTTVGARGNVLSGFALDMRFMANGSTNDPFTRSQTKGIHIDATWNVQLRSIYVTNVPSNAAGIFVDDGAGHLGCFWGRMDNVFVDAYTKKGIANGFTGPGQQANPPQAARDQSARGIVFTSAQASPAVTAWTLTDVTSYRGIYMRNCVVMTGINVHSERGPGHCVYIDGGERINFIGGFFEYGGNEKLTGDDTLYRPFFGVNLPRKVSIRGGAYVGNGIDISQWGPGFEVDDPLSIANGDRYKHLGDLHINRSGQGHFAGATDVRLLGPYSAGAMATNSDATIYGAKDPTNNPKTYDAGNLYQTGSSNFNILADVQDGLIAGKLHIAYAMYVRSTNGTFAADDYVDVKLVMNTAMKYPNGTAGGSDIRNRHFLSAGGSKQLLTGVLEVSITNTVNGAFTLKGNTNRANTAWGLSSSDDDRGFISYRVIA